MFAHRTATPRDFKIISQFPSSAEELSFMAPNLTFPATAQDLANIAATRDSPTLLTWRDSPAAYATLYLCDGRRFIGNVIVAPAYRGKGAGCALIDVMCRISRDQYGAQEIRLSCTNQNTIGLLLYMKLGFTPYAMSAREGLDGDRHALIHLRRDLSGV